MTKAISLILLTFLLLPHEAEAQTRIDGPIAAKVIQVIDGDTVEVEIAPWFGVRLITRVRLSGIDAPEMRSPCADERERAEAAKDYLIAFLAGEPVYLSEVRRGKYFGRVIARLANHQGMDATEALLKAGHGVPYDGGRRAPSSCGDLAASN